MLQKELEQISLDLTDIIEAVKKYKESPNDYEANLMTPRLGKRNFMDLGDELRAKQGRLAVYANKEKQFVDAENIKEDIVNAIKILRENMTEIRAVTNISEDVKKQCHSMLVKLDQVIAMDELRNAAGNKPAP